MKDNHRTVATHGPKPTRIPFGLVCDAMLDNEDTLLALLALSNDLWLSARDRAETGEIRHIYKSERHPPLDELCERMVELLRRYLMEYTTFAVEDTPMGLYTRVRPDDVALHRAEHDEHILLRGGMFPDTPNRKIKLWLGEHTDGKGTTHQMLYRRTAGKGLSGWELIWQYTPPPRW